MTSEQQQRIDALYDEARQLDPGDREAFIRSRCDGQEELRHEVESLLQHGDTARDFLELSALDLLASVISEDPRSMVGRTVGNYEILSLIGRGGMGEVWKARDTRLGREVAIKMLPEQFAQDRERIARLEREAQVLASLNHPGIAAIYGFEEFDDMRFLVLEFVVPAAAGAVPFDLSNLGLLAYVGGAPLENNRILALVDREGRVEVLNLPPKPYLSPRMLPDGNQLAVQVDEDGRSSIWVYELSGETQIRELTPDSDSVRPVWSADSERVTFASIREDKRGIFW